MTVVVQTPYNAHLANGVTTLFGFTFQLLDEGDLQVSLDGVVQMGGYTISGLGVQAGGSVTFSLAPENNVLVELQRQIPLARSTDYQQNGDLPEAVLDHDFDRLWQALQDQAYFTSFTIALPPGDAAAPMILPTVVERASKFFAFNALGEAIAALGVPDVPTTPFAATLLDDPDASTARATLGAAAAGAISSSGLTMSTDRALLRTTAGTGAPEEKTKAQFLAWLGVSLDQIAQPGDLKPFSGASAPSGWLALPTAPTNISRTTYAALFAAIGTTWGAGDGSTTFGMPYCPEGHTLLNTASSVGSATVGQVIAHQHGYAGDGVSVTAGGQGILYWGSGANLSSSTGGSANLAAGVKVRWCVKT